MKDKDVLFVSIATLITALAWVVFDAYHAYTTSTISKDLNEIALPITPKIDITIVNSLKSRTEPVINYQLPLPSVAAATASGVKRGTKR